MCEEMQVVPWFHEFTIVDRTFFCGWTVFATTILVYFQTFPFYPLKFFRR